MKALRPTTALTRILATSLALLIALCLSAPAQAKDIELEPYGLSGETASAPSSASEGDAAGSAEKLASADSRSSANDNEGLRSQSSSDSRTLSSFFGWLSALPIFNF